VSRLYYSRFRSDYKYPRIVGIIEEWCVNVGAWIIALMIAYALVGMSA
jgi:hypothetical protein